MSRIRANTIMDQAGSGSPDFPYGFTASSGTVSGILTATTYDLVQINVSSAATIGGATEITDTTSSTSTTTGALIVSGGVGIAGSVFIGENLSVGGTVTYEDVTNIDSVGIITAQSGMHVTGGGLTLVGVTTGLSVSGVSTFAGEITVSAGGVDVTGGANIASGIVTVGDTTESTNKDTGSIITNGGVGIEKNLNVGTAVTLSGAGIATFSQGMKIGGGNALQEKCHIETTAWSASVSAGDINLDYGMVHLNTAVLAGTGNTLNITSSVGINTGMQTGDTIAVTGITSVNATSAFVNTLKIDHNEVQVAWVNGNAPTKGGSSGYDTYAFNIIKTADAAYAVIGNHTKTS